MVIKNGFQIHKVGDNYRRTMTSMNTGGWFFITVFLSINSFNFQDFKKSFPYIFDKKHESTPHSYLSYLTDAQYNEFSNNNNFLISKADMELFQNISTRTSSYIVHAYDKWNNGGKCRNIAFDTFLCESLTENEAKEISYLPEVLYLHPSHGVHFNSRFAAGYLQGGVDELKYEGKLLRVPRKLQEIGLDGSDEIVSVIDTGVKVNHSFYHDSSHQVVYNETNLEHRKIVRYDSFFDENDSSDGHGTAFCGVIAGTPENEDDANKLYEGVAPGAKLHIIDVSNDSTQFYSEPDPYNQTYHMKNLGSHISGNSWMLDSMTDLSVKYNEIAYDNKENLYVFSSGNNPDGCAILTPADAKNVLTVGSTNRPGSSVIEDPSQRNIILTNGTHAIDAYSPFAGCGAYQTKSPLMDLHDLLLKDVDDNGIALISNECVCSSLKANLLIYLDDDISCNETESTPTLYINSTDADLLKSMKSVSVSYHFDEVEIKVSEKSGQGPNYYMMKKPDLVAPGENIVTANANSSFGDSSFESLINCSGTSFSAAEVTGLAAIARQYFAKGYYPSLKPSADDAFSPTSALLKATLINSATQLNTDEGIFSYASGFGIPNLGRGLGYEEGIGVRFIDDVTVSANDHIQYSLMTERVANLSVTMNYMDVSTDIFNYHFLYADLDLVVEDPDGNVYNGNQLINNKPEEFTPVERIFIKDAPIGRYLIHVYSSSYSDSKTVDMALAISGGFETSNTSVNPKILKPFASDEKTCPNNCGSGVCENGACTCPIDYTGSYCQSSVKVLNTGEYSAFQVYPGSMQWYRASFPEGSTISIQMQGIPLNNEQGAYMLSISTIGCGIVNQELNGRAYANYFTYTTGSIGTYDTTFVYWGFYPLGRSPMIISSMISITPPRTPMMTPNLTPTFAETPRETPEPTPDLTPAQSPSCSPTFGPSPVETPIVTPGRTIVFPTAINVSSDDSNFNKFRYVDSSVITWIIIGISIGIVIIIVLTVLCCFCCRKHNDAVSNSYDGEDSDAKIVFREKYYNAKEDSSDIEEFKPKW